jgi:glycosyltransferase involved in cell wall biosynthesis
MEPEQERGPDSDPTEDVEGRVELLQELLAEAHSEKQRLEQSAEVRLGRFVLDRLRFRGPFRRTEALRSLLRHRATLGGLGAKSRVSRLRRRLRVLASACWDFPIYSQTFVHQELAQLANADVDLTIVYSLLRDRSNLHSQFDSLWPRRCRLVLDERVHDRDVRFFRRRMPERVDRLTRQIARAAGMTVEELEGRRNFREAFSYARLVEAYRPDYLHSYFFYDRTFMTFVASQLLGIPRGISCYADHMLQDYEFKLVPLQLQASQLVVATSRRVRDELISVAPGIDPGKIVVKPNAIDCTRFPQVERQEPEGRAPYRLCCVSRMEPKKGLEFLVRAVSLLVGWSVPVELHILGGPDTGNTTGLECQARLRQLIAREGLHDVVHLAGVVGEDRVAEALSQSHVFVAPFVETAQGDKDGIPTALLEAMSTGLPSVITDAGSLTEAFEGQRDAVVVKQRHPGSLARGIRELLGDPSRRAAMGAAAARRAREHFDVSVAESALHSRMFELMRPAHGASDLDAEALS